MAITSSEVHKSLTETIYSNTLHFLNKPTTGNTLSKLVQKVANLAAVAFFAIVETLFKAPVILGKALFERVKKQEEGERGEGEEVAFQPSAQEPPGLAPAPAPEAAAVTVEGVTPAETSTAAVVQEEEGVAETVEPDTKEEEPVAAVEEEVAPMPPVFADVEKPAAPQKRSLAKLGFAIIALAAFGATTVAYRHLTTLMTATAFHI